MISHTAYGPRFNLERLDHLFFHLADWRCTCSCSFAVLFLFISPTVALELISTARTVGEVHGLFHIFYSVENRGLKLGKMLFAIAVSSLALKVLQPVSNRSCHASCSENIGYPDVERWKDNVVPPEVLSEDYPSNRAATARFPEANNLVYR